MTSETYYTIQQIKEALAHERKKEAPKGEHQEQVATIMDKVLEVLEDLEIRVEAIEKGQKKIKRQIDE
jgi:hypothetical protein